LVLLVYVSVSLTTLLAASSLGLHRGRLFQDTLIMSGLLIPIALVYPNLLNLRSKITETPRKEHKHELWSLTAFLLAMAVRTTSISLYAAPLEKVAVAYLVLMLITLVYGKHPREIGFTQRKIRPNLLLGTAVGACLFACMCFADTITYSLLARAGINVSLRPDLLRVLDALLYHYACVAVSEELLFRGLIQTSIAEGKGFLKALAVSSCLFGSWHLLWGIPYIGRWEMGRVLEYSVSYMVSSTFFGLVVGSLYHQTQHLGAPIAVHGFWNLLSTTIVVSFSLPAPLTWTAWLQVQLVRYVVRGLVASAFGLIIVKKVRRELFSPMNL